MKPWHIAAAVLGLAIVYILVKRPVLPITGQTTQAGSNDLFRAIGSLAGLGTAIVGKIGAPSQIGTTDSAPFSSSAADQREALGAYDSGSYSYS